MTIACALGLLAAPFGIASTSQWQSLAEVSAIAEAHARAKLGRGDIQVETAVKALDSRLKLARCNQPLSAFTPPNTELRQNVIIGVRCRGTKPWKVYVPVRVTARRSVLVAVRPLGRGAVLGPADVRVEARDITSLRATYLTDPAQVSGKVLKRSIPEGRVMSVDLLNEADIVKRGERVTLLVEQSGFVVQMAGTALSSGAINERVRVENASSKRTVEGVVRAPQLVEVLSY
ncbi:MAG: flagellar basal body P-ring formation chaperone FlgA [Pseudomonadota bacterium]